MKVQALSHFNMTWLTCTALLIFFSAFIAILATALNKSNRSLYEQLETIPLLDGEKK